MRMRMKQISPPLIIFVSAVLGSARGNSAVKTSSASYSCCEPTIHFNPRCEVLWNINNRPFAHAKEPSNGCIPPCRGIEGGRMVLDRCPDVNATVVCTDEDNVTTEERKSYHGKPCSGSDSNYMAANPQGLVWSLLLIVAITGSIEMC